MGGVCVSGCNNKGSATRVPWANSIFAATGVADMEAKRARQPQSEVDPCRGSVAQPTVGEHQAMPTVGRYEEALNAESVV